MLPVPPRIRMSSDPPENRARIRADRGSPRDHDFRIAVESGALGIRRRSILNAETIHEPPREAVHRRRS
jgi:hypothetical protein